MSISSISFLTVTIVGAIAIRTVCIHITNMAAIAALVDICKKSKFFQGAKLLRQCLFKSYLDTKANLIYLNILVHFQYILSYKNNCRNHQYCYSLHSHHKRDCQCCTHRYLQKSMLFQRAKLLRQYLFKSYFYVKAAYLMYLSIFVHFQYILPYKNNCGNHYYWYSLHSHHKHSCHCCTRRYFQRAKLLT